jgi:hypothetical protein
MRSNVLVLLALVTGCSLVGYDPERVKVRAVDAGGAGQLAMDGAVGSKDGGGPTDAGPNLDGSKKPPKDAEAMDAQLPLDGGCDGSACSPISSCDGSDCNLACQPGAPCDLTCDTGLRCIADCAGSGTICKVVTCVLGSKCDIDCEKAGSCGQVKCAAGAECILRCGANEACSLECEGGEEQVCPGDGNYRVCNAECP